jgi:hypothetical protein
VLEVADQLAEDPRLVRVGDTAMLFLHHRAREDLAPRVVMQSDPLQLAFVDPHGMLPGHRGDVVGDSEQGVKALLAGDVEIVLQLLDVESVCTGLHLHQSGPRLFGPRDSDQPIGVAP